MSDEEHVVQTVATEKDTGAMRYTEYVGFCTCGKLFRPFGNWYYTQRGIQQAINRHLSVATGKIDRTSTEYQEFKLRDFMSKRGEEVDEEWLNDVLENG